MILFSHMLAGAVIGSKTGNYWIIFILSVIFHFIADHLPHWDYIDDIQNESEDRPIKILGKGFIDLGIGVVFILAVFWNSPMLDRTAAGALFSVLPDILIVIYFLAKKNFGFKIQLLEDFAAFHKDIAYVDSKKNKIKEIAWEAAFSAIFIFIILL